MEHFGTFGFEGTHGVLTAELVGIRFRHTHVVQELGVLAPGNNAVVVQVLQLEQCLNIGHAGLVVCNFFKCLFGGEMRTKWQVRVVTGESISRQWCELTVEDEASNGNGHKHNVRVNSRNDVGVADVLLGGGTCSILIAGIGFLIAFVASLVIIVIKVSNEFVSDVTKR
jgi:hypothetical protein